MKDDGFFRSINRANCWYKDDPFILSTQATKIFYLKDTVKNAKSWSVVQKFTHKHLWSVTENDNDERSGGSGLSYQDDTCEGFQVRLNEGNLDSENLDNEDCLHVDASVIDELRAQGQEEMEELYSSNENETGWQYISDNEGPTNPLDEDEDSDG